MKNKLQVMRTNKIYIYFIISLSAILYTAVMNAFVSVAHIFPAGLSSLSFIPSVFIKDLTPFITGIYLVLNIPLIIIFWNKIKKKFLYRTVYFLIFQADIGLLFLIPDLKTYAGQLIIQTLNIDKEIWPIFLLAAIGAIFMGFSMAYMWKLGGSTGGVNFIVYYYSTKKKLSIGFVAFIVSIIFVSISFGVTIPFNEESRKNYASKVIATILYMAINLSVTNLIYPKYTKTWFEIHTTKKEEIEEFFSKYNHAFQSRKVISGYTKKEKIIFTLAVFHLESKSLKKELLNIDKDIWISITKLKKVVGNLSTKNIE